MRIASRFPLTGRGVARSVAAANIDSTVGTRTAPVRARAASKASSDPRGSRGAPARCRPAFTTTTGLIRAASRSPERSARADPIVSTYRRMLFVAGSSARNSSTSPKSTSIASPSDTTVENPTRWALAQSSAAAQIAPDCDTSPSEPGIAPPAVNVASSAATGRRSPTLFGPTSRRPPRAAASSRLRAAP